MSYDQSMKFSRKQPKGTRLCVGQHFNPSGIQAPETKPRKWTAKDERKAQSYYRVII